MVNFYLAFQDMLVLCVCVGGGAEFRQLFSKMSPPTHIHKFTYMWIALANSKLESGWLYVSLIVFYTPIFKKYSCHIETILKWAPLYLYNELYHTFDVIPT